MAATYYQANGTIGANFEERGTVQKFPLGAMAIDQKGYWHVYVLASEAVTSTCTVNTSTWALTDTAGNYTADTAFASGDYGWVRRTTGEAT